MGITRIIFPQTDMNNELAHRIYLSNLDECLYFPKYFEIETVNACNARCIMCTVEMWNRDKNPVMNMELFSNYVNEVKNYSDWIETVCLSRDGEPTLDQHLALKVRMLKDVGIKKVTFSTNGQLLKAELVKALIESGLDDIMISIDGFTKETFEKIRRGLDFDVVVNNTKKLIALRDEMNSKMTIRIRMVANNENLHEADDWLDYWAKYVGIQDKVYIMPLHTWGNQIKLEDSNLVSTIAAKPCVSPFSTMIIHADGKVGLCGVDYNNKYLMGDFNQQSIKEIWQGQEFSRMREFHATERKNEIELCEGCDLWDREYTVLDKKNR